MEENSYLVKETFATFIDFHRTFDSINRNLLGYKLHTYLDISEREEYFKPEKFFFNHMSNFLKSSMKIYL